MTTDDREEFEKWAILHGFDVEKWSNGNYKSGPTVYVLACWEEQQKKIDALKSELKAAEDFHVFALEERNAAWDKIKYLKAENATLKAAIPDGEDRVFACLTACVGFSTETLEELPGTFGDILLRVGEREKKLRKAAEEVLKIWEGKGRTDMYGRVMENLRAALEGSNEPHKRKADLSEEPGG